MTADPPPTKSSSVCRAAPRYSRGAVILPREFFHPPNPTVAGRALSSAKESPTVFPAPRTVSTTVLAVVAGEEVEVEEVPGVWGDEVVVVVGELVPDSLSVTGTVDPVEAGVPLWPGLRGAVVRMV